jgi:hypothetical protein
VGNDLGKIVNVLFPRGVAVAFRDASSRSSVSSVPWNSLHTGVVVAIALLGLVDRAISLCGN